MSRDGQKPGLLEPAVYVPPRVDPIVHLSAGLTTIFSDPGPILTDGSYAML